MSTLSKAEASKGKPPTMSQTAQDMLRKEGVGVFFHGVLPALVLVSNPAIQFMVFEKLKSWVELRRPKGAKFSDMDFFFLGLVSKFAASTVTYPYTLLKSKVCLDF